MQHKLLWSNVHWSKLPPALELYCATCAVSQHCDTVHVLSHSTLLCDSTVPHVWVPLLPRLSPFPWLQNPPLVLTLDGAVGGPSEDSFVEEEKDGVWSVVGGKVHASIYAV